MAIFQSSLWLPPPTLPAPRSLVFPRRGGGGGRSEIRPHIQIQASALRPPSAPPGLQFPCHLCASPSACNSTTARPWTSAEESIYHLRKEGARRRKTEGKRRERQRAGGRGGCSVRKGEVRKSESETPWNLITERVVSGRGGEQIKLA